MSIAKVVETFRRQQKEGVFPGGQLVVMRRGEVLVDEAVGVARGWRKRARRRSPSRPSRSSACSARESRSWRSRPRSSSSVARSRSSHTTRQTSGTDRTVRIPMVLGRGFALGWFWPHPYGWWRTSECFGHAGNFSTLAWADPKSGCAIAGVTNGNRAPMKLVRRFAPIGTGLRSAGE